MKDEGTDRLAVDLSQVAIFNLLAATLLPPTAATVMFAARLKKSKADDEKKGTTYTTVKWRRRIHELQLMLPTDKRTPPTKVLKAKGLESLAVFKANVVDFMSYMNENDQSSFALIVAGGLCFSSAVQCATVPLLKVNSAGYLLIHNQGGFKSKLVEAADETVYDRELREARLA